MEWGFLALGVVLLLVALGTYKSTAARLARIEQKLNALLREQGVDPAQGVQLSDRVKQLALDPSMKIEAIKLYREETGASLAEAKQAVETFMNGQ